MLFNIALYISLAIFLAGAAWKAGRWFRLGLTDQARSMGAGKRLAASLRGMGSAVFGPRLPALARTFVLDVLFQARTLKESPYRWAMHILLMWGFTLLLLMHALEAWISEPLLPGYVSTLAPYPFLRDAFGAMVLAGAGMAMYRRGKLKGSRLRSGPRDTWAIAILAVIMLSGVLLEGAKISSHTEFMDMAQEYAFLEEPDVKALESLWVEEFALIAPGLEGPFDQAVLDRGRELHEESCASCHSTPDGAFLGLAAARTLGPAFAGMGDAAMVALFWNLHFLACFAGLAYLPFSKFFHILTGPLSLLVDAGMDMTRADPANVATRRMIELDACTHCGACTLRCSVGVCVEAVGNENLLPSEKLEPLRTLAAGGTLDSKALDALLEGLHFCTNCRRCSGVCPVGIDLQAMWAEVREDLLAKGGAEPLLLSQLALYRALSDDTESPAYKGPQAAARAAVDAAFPFDREAESVDMDQRDRAMQRTLRESAQGASFSYCFNCRTCSSSCPLPKEHEDPFEALDMLPHQIIHATALGLSSMAVGSRMLWSCLGCYRCQERCPQGVRVADVFFHLKNVALDRARNRQEAS